MVDVVKGFQDFGSTTSLAKRNARDKLAASFPEVSDAMYPILNAERFPQTALTPDRQFRNGFSMMIRDR